MALRKVLQTLTERQAERGLILDRPPIPFVITDSGYDDSDKHEITLRVDPSKSGNNFKKKVHVFGGGDSRGCYDLVGGDSTGVEIKTVPDSPVKI